MIWAQGYKGPVTGIGFVIYAPKGTRPSKVENFRFYLNDIEGPGNLFIAKTMIDPHWAKLEGIRNLPGQAILMNESESVYAIMKDSTKAQVISEMIEEIQSKQAEIARRNRNVKR